MFDASWIHEVASLGWSKSKNTSARSSHTCSCNNHARWGPGLGTKELSEDATSDSACSTLEAARDWAWMESKKKSLLRNLNHVFSQ